MLPLGNRGYPLESAPVGTIPLSPGPLKPVVHVSSSPVASRDAHISYAKRVHISYAKRVPRVKSGITGTWQLVYKEDECKSDPLLFMLDHSLHSAPIMSDLYTDHIQCSNA